MPHNPNYIHGTTSHLTHTHIVHILSIYLAACSFLLLFFIGHTLYCILFCTYWGREMWSVLHCSLAALLYDLNFPSGIRVIYKQCPLMRWKHCGDKYTCILLVGKIRGWLIQWHQFIFLGAKSLHQWEVHWRWLRHPAAPPAGEAPAPYPTVCSLLCIHHLGRLGQWKLWTGQMTNRSCCFIQTTIYWMSTWFYATHCTLRQYYHVICF